MNNEYCIVIDNWLSYNMYDEWIEHNFPNYIEDFVFEHDFGDIQPDRLYKIIGKAPHLVSPKTMLYLIQDTDTKQVFIIEEDGIEKTTTIVSMENTNTIRCDVSLDEAQYTYDIRGGERNMDNKIVDLYYERKKKELLDKYEKMINDEYEANEAVKEYTELKNTFETALAEMADRYNKSDLQIIVKTGYIGNYPYELNDDIMEEIKKAHREEYNAELKQLELLVEEVRAMLSFSDSDEYRLNVLKEYDIINKKGKLNV